jgi:glycosyltransferase involved in cell wall biosynthesis
MQDAPRISVLMTAHNPHRGRLERALAGLRSQTLSPAIWEFILVDNASSPPLCAAELGVDGFPNTTMVREEKLGVLHGRMTAVRNARADIVVFVDDDNVLSPNYLADTLDIFVRMPRLGVGGGKRLAEWETVAPEPWMEEFVPNLAIADCGDKEVIAQQTTPLVYPECGPLTAGMIARRELLEKWADERCASGILLGRRGRELTSGEDHDIVLHIFCAGWQVGYFPQLRLHHIIPKERLTLDYLARLQHGIGKSWVHWATRYGLTEVGPAARWTVPLRKARAFLRCRAWVGPAEYVRWRGLCGQFEGRAELLASAAAGHDRG